MGHLANILPSTLAALLDAAGIEELMVNPDGVVWVEKLGEVSESSHVLSISERERLARHLASEWHIDLAPLMSGSIEQVRVQAVSPPLVEAPTFSFRLPGRRSFGLNEFGMDDDQCQYIKTSVRSGRSILISGGTSSGKTSFANALLDMPAFREARLVVIEDTPELQPRSRDVVRLCSSDEIGPRALVRTALRLRPDRLILGEVRGGEAYDLLQALNTGHGGSLTTIHANSPKDALERLLDLAREAVPGLGASAIERANFLTVQLGRVSGQRRVIDIVDHKTKTIEERSHA